MKRDDGSVMAMINNNYQRLTELERGIADFFLNNTEDMDFSAKNIAPKLFVSIPSLSRFAKKCGFQGYREFVYSYKQCLKNFGATEECKLYDTLKLYDDLLQEMNRSLKTEQIECILTNILKKERVIICGEGEAGLSALRMELRFLHMGINTIALTDAEKMRLYAPFTDEKCIVIGMSVDHNSKGVRYILEKAKGKCASTVMITTNPTDEINKFCDEIVRVPTFLEVKGDNAISSQFLLGIIEDLLYLKFKCTHQR